MRPGDLKVGPQIQIQVVMPPAQSLRVKHSGMDLSHPPTLSCRFPDESSFCTRLRTLCVDVDGPSPEIVFERFDRNMQPHAATSHKGGVKWIPASRPPSAEDEDVNASRFGRFCERKRGLEQSAPRTLPAPKKFSGRTATLSRVSPLFEDVVLSGNHPSSGCLQEDARFVCNTAITT